MPETAEKVEKVSTNPLDNDPDIIALRESNNLLRNFGMNEPKPVKEVEATKKEPEKKVEEPEVVKDVPKKEPEEKKDTTVKDVPKPSSKKEKVEEPEDDDPFAAKKEGEDIEFKDLAELGKYFKEKMGIEDPSQLPKTAQKWRALASQYPEVAGELAKLKKFMADAPAVLKDGWTAYQTGRDYNSVMRPYLSDVDYSIPFEKQNIKSLVRAFRPDVNVTDDKADDYIDLADAKEKFTKLLIDSVHDKFIDNQKAIVLTSDAMKKEQQQQAQSILESVDKSLSKLSDEFPAMKAGQLEEVGRIMRTYDAEKELLLDEKGNYLPDAAKKISLLLFSESQLKKKDKQIETLKERVNELLGKGDESVKVTKKNAVTEKVENPEVKEAQRYYPKRSSPYSNYEVVR